MKTTNPSLGMLCLCFFLSVSISLNASSNTAFSLTCPNDVYVTCEEELWDLTIYGDAYIHDYSGTYPAGAPVVTYNLNSCNIGQIYRTWTVEDYNWVMHTCTQVINVSGTNVFTAADITWPLDADLEGCNPNTHPNNLPYDQGYPQYISPWCSNIGTSYTDQVFHFGGSCKKIMRKWSVIDWCQYIPNSGSTKGLWTYWQVIKIAQNDIPEVLCTDVITTSSYNCYDAQVSVPDLEVDPSICGGDFIITNNSPYADDDGANISGIYPIGTTTVQYTVKYGCGKKAYCYQDIVVEDGKGPTPYCYYEVTTVLMPMDEDGDGIPESGMVQIWAKDLDKDSYSPCGHYPIQFSFSPDVIEMFKTFTCDDVGENLINMYVHDSKGGVSYCTVKVHIQNNSGIENCEGTVNTTDPNLTSIAGRVTDIFQKDVESFSIECSNHFEDVIIESVYDTTSTYVIVDSFYNAGGVLIYHLNEVQTITETSDTTFIELHDVQEVNSDDSGVYTFDSVQMYKDYTLAAITDQQTKDDINACDVERLIDHLLGTDIIADPYLLLAADVNDSKSVDFGDLKEMLQYISGAITEFSAEEKYMIISSDYEFSVSYDPFYEDYPTFRFYEGLEGSMSEANFIYILKGNLCEDSDDFINPINQNNMNVLSALTERLPLSLRNEIRKEVNYTPPSIAEFTVYPNPFINDFQISIHNPEMQQVDVKLTDTNGKVVLRKSEYVGKGDHTLKMGLPEESPSGIYFYNITAGKSQSYGRIMKR